MPKSHRRTPKYRLHRASGLAVVTLSGRDIYLGPDPNRIYTLIHTGKDSAGATNVEEVYVDAGGDRAADYSEDYDKLVVGEDRFYFWGDVVAFLRSRQINPQTQSPESSSTERGGGGEGVAAAASSRS